MSKRINNMFIDAVDDKDQSNRQPCPLCVSIPVKIAGMAISIIGANSIAIWNFGVDVMDVNI